MTFTAFIVAVLAFFGFERRASPGAPRRWTRDELEALATRLAREEGLPDAVPFLALIDTESDDWNPLAKNCAGGDGERGCSWGPAQITLLTAREMDDRKPTAWREIDPARGGATLLDPEIGLRLAARYFAGGYEIAKKENPVRVWGDAAARYNAGWARGLDRAPASTRDTYVPRFERNLSRRLGVV